ncbi:MAG: hypothetical protein ISS71_08255 [Phycisphaerae bacterium]|nr:hypothetical protein [Phycisphaerae bacterium]
MTYILGIDAGSSYIKFVLIDETGGIIGKSIVPRGAEIDASCRKNYEILSETLEIDQKQIDGIIATGYGRKQVSFADEVITEITALAIAGYSITPNIRMIIDIGGQDSKVVSLNESGKVIDFVMNQKCSAGTGKFLEVTSASLGVKVEDLGPLSLNADKDLSLSSTCTVFAESEIISFVAAGQKKENIIKALHNTISSQILGLYYQANADDQGEILFAGGVALNDGMVTQLSSKLNQRVRVPENPQFICALGAALFLKNKQMKKPV